MPNKENVLQSIRELAEQKLVTKTELEVAYNAGSKGDSLLQKKLGVAEILYYIGGAIVFLGIAILISQNWSILGFGTKLIVTLGVGIVSYIAGILLNRNQHTQSVGSAFYLIAALVMPIGLYVFFDHIGFTTDSSETQSLISAIMLSIFLLSYLVFRKSIFILFSIIFATWLYYSLTSYITSTNSLLDSSKFDAYRILSNGLVYMLLGYSFTKNKYTAFSGFLYGFGIVGFLGAALYLGGWQPDQNIFWELIYPILVFATLFLSVSLKKGSFLVWGTIFLMLYILKITSEYFTSGLGWPISLVIVGIAMIGIGYMSLTLKKKYLS